MCKTNHTWKLEEIAVYDVEHELQLVSRQLRLLDVHDEIIEYETTTVQSVHRVSFN